VKILVTFCVPFCVSLFGAYVAYLSVLSDQQKAAGLFVSGMKNRAETVVLKIRTTNG
jgi:hypothetical protein